MLSSVCAVGCAVVTLAASACSDSEPGSPAANPSAGTGEGGSGSSVAPDAGAAGSSMTPEVGAAGSSMTADPGSNPGGFSGTGDGGGAGTGMSGATSAPADPFDAPHNSAELLPFLMARSYGTWLSEPDFHVSSGPHGESVRVFYGPRAAAALGAREPHFPTGAAAIKEVASATGSIVGWSAWVKVQSDSDSGRGFYWYEVALRAPNNTVYADALGSAVCVGCHSSGVDYRLSVTPL